jgi:large subunit ribosomal protein L31
MKVKIHPTYYPNAKVICACGNTFTVGSTKEEIQVEVCSACHPFFTGEAKYIDTQGRVEKFEEQRRKAAPGQIIKKKQKKILKRLEEERREAARPKSLKEMFEKKHG